MRTDKQQGQHKRSILCGLCRVEYEVFLQIESILIPTITIFINGGAEL